jgi:tetratricopeptide (TPR) repeat protein
MTNRLAAVCVIAVLGMTAACSTKSDAKDAAKLLDAGLAAHVANNTVRAKADYLAVLQKDPANKFALYNLGLLAQQAGQPAEAETRYRTVLVIDPNYEPALFNVAILRTDVAPEEAVALYRRALVAKPDDAGAHLNLGLLLRKLGNNAEGDAEVAKAQSINPKLVVPDAAAPAAAPDSKATTTTKK